MGTLLAALREELADRIEPVDWKRFMIESGYMVHG